MMEFGGYVLDVLAGFGAGRGDSSKKNTAQDRSFNHSLIGHIAGGLLMQVKWHYLTMIKVLV